MFRGQGRLTRYLSRYILGLQADWDACYHIREDSRLSIEIWQFPKCATKEQLRKCLLELGYVKGRNLFWPGPPGTLSFFWQQTEDYRSTSGVDASILPLDAQGQAAWNTDNEWAVRTRTSIWASTFDKDFHNRTVRHIRTVFGGTFYNDEFGRNRYIVVEHRESTPVSRGVHAVLMQLEAELDALEHALPAEMIEGVLTPRGGITEATDETGIVRFSKQMDPARTVYNALVPFLVAVIEHFFRECFEILLKYDSSAIGKLEEQSRKLSFTEATAIARHELTVERVVSGWYSFQNMESIQKAYKDLFEIDVWKVLRLRKKVRGRLPTVLKALRELIGARHGVVHHFSMDRDLDREGFLYLLHLVRALLGLVSEEIEHKLGVELGPG